MKQRIDSIDIARGMAMLLVIIQHCGAFSQFILSFHMPLFFMVSGLVVTANKPSLPFWQDVTKNLQRLLVPQMTLGILECVFIILSTYYYEHRFTMLGFHDIINAILRWWFLLVLFQCRLILWFFKKYIFGSRIREIITITCLVILSGSVYAIPGRLNELPVYMNLVPICLLFVLMGYYAKSLLVRKMNFAEGAIILLLLAITVIVSQINTRVVMYNMEVGNLFLFLMTSVCGSVFFIKFSTAFNSNLIKWIGIKCMPIYVLQFHVVQYSMAIEATLLDMLECEDMIIKTTVLIIISLITCCLLTYYISMQRGLRFIFGVTN